MRDRSIRKFAVLVVTATVFYAVGSVVSSHELERTVPQLLQIYSGLLVERGDYVVVNESGRYVATYAKDGKFKECRRLSGAAESLSELCGAAEMLNAIQPLKLSK